MMTTPAKTIITSRGLFFLHQLLTGSGKGLAEDLGQVAVHTVVRPVAVDLVLEDVNCLRIYHISVPCAGGDVVGLVISDEDEEEIAGIIPEELAVDPLLVGGIITAVTVVVCYVKEGPDAGLLIEVLKAFFQIFLVGVVDPGLSLAGVLPVAVGGIDLTGVLGTSVAGVVCGIAVAVRVSYTHKGEDDTYHDEDQEDPENCGCTSSAGTAADVSAASAVHGVRRDPQLREPRRYERR